MTDIDIAFESKKFSMDWHERGYEKGETQKFWRAILKKILRVDEPDEFIDFEQPVRIDGQTKFIDAYIPQTKILIEQKSFGIDLDKAELQSDGSELTPYQQALRYANSLPDDKKPLRIIVCNFAEFHVYKSDSIKPIIIKLRDLVYEYPRLKILIDPNADDSPPQERISKSALADIDRIYKAFAENYKRNKINDYEDDLNKICTRLVFCFYACDAKIFDTAQKIFDANKFFGYILKFDTKERIAALQKIFDALSLEKNMRGDLDDDLKTFPYINGGLFDEKIPMPAYNKFITNPSQVIDNVKGIRNFRWREISPPIFGAMFESNFNSQREGGMYYTSVENIHKVIDPLFMDDLQDEFANIKRMQKKNRVAALKSFQDKLASFNFLDPACGSGNFLTETFLSLRRLENEVIEEMIHLYAELPNNPIKVSPRQFYGIEIDSFAVAVARLALCIADIQMKRETSWIINRDLPELPLDKYVSVICANALRVDWKKFAPNVDFIIGNPPFIGARLKSAAQADDIQRVFAGWNNIGNLDYVACWFKKAADFIQGTAIRCAFVSTNSVCQGDSVGTLWKNLFAAGIHIDFAHRTFKWLSDSDNMAHVHCVVVGFSTAPNNKPRKIFDGDKVTIAANINAYLVDGEDIFVESRNAPLQNFVPQMQFANQPLDDGNYRFTPEEMEDFIKLEPAAQKYFHRWVGAEEFIKGKRRYCLWLGDLTLEEIKKMPLCYERAEAVKTFRLASRRTATKRLAATPTRFQVENFPTKKYLAVPQTSSERRQYIPIGFLDSSNIASEKLLIIPDATLYHFGVLTSSIHMAWTRATCGRLENRYSYSIAVVYNNFPWCEPSTRQKRRIEETAAEILAVRASFSDWTLARLYDPQTMPADLRDAHKENDLAVALAYGMEKYLEDEGKIVAELMRRYDKLANGR